MLLASSFLPPQRIRIYAAMLSCVMACAGGEISDDSQESDASLELKTMVTAVGTAGGRLAIQFKQQWFSVYLDEQGWKVENKVEAADLYVSSTDSTVTTAGCQVGGRAAKDETIEKCDGRISDERVEKRQFPNDPNGFLTVQGQKYRVEVIQVIREQRHLLPGTGPLNRVITTRDLELRVTAVDALDGNNWEIRVTPKRTSRGALGVDDETLNARYVEAVLAGDSNTDGLDEAMPVKPQERRIIEYSPEVEIEGVYKVVSGKQAELDSVSNSALEDAFAQAANQENDHSSAGHIAGFTKLMGVYQRGETTIRDFKRLYQFFAKGTKSSAGFSKGKGVCGPGQSSFSSEGFGLKDKSGQQVDGSGDTPRAISSSGHLRFQAPIVECRHFWPFLWGVCGAEFTIASGVAGSLTYGSRMCFNGKPTSINFNGCMEFRAEAGGGVSCDLFVASASVGLRAGVATGACFGSHFDALKPSINAFYETYSRVNLAAYFRARLLFWQYQATSTLAETVRFGGRFEKRVPLISRIGEIDQACAEMEKPK